MKDDKLLNYWIKECNLVEEDEIKGSYYPRKKEALNLVDINATDGFRDIIVYQFHGMHSKGKFAYKKLKNIIKQYKSKENNLEIYVSFNDYEAEQKVIENLRKKANNALDKKEISETFDFFLTRYISGGDMLSLEVSDKGVNYLTSPEYLESKINGYIYGIVVNCSLYELKKIYNATGDRLFRGNVRQGIDDNNAQLRRIFRNYLEIDDSEERGIKEENGYDSKLFWYSHNGVTVYVEDNENQNFTFEKSRIKLIPNECSVINGAQTIFNLFKVYSELKLEYENDKDWSKLDELDGRMKTTYVKLTIIHGDSTLSKFITRGLNTQIPISIADFEAISDEVSEINKLSWRYVHILKTGEMKKENSLSPIKFVKNYLVAEGKPGLSKNYNKNEISNTVKEIHEKLINRSQDDGNARLSEVGIDILKKIKVMPMLEEWFQANNKGTSIFDRYGLTYFQSYVISRYKSDDLEDISKEQLFGIYSEVQAILRDNDRGGNISDYKNDELFEFLKSKIQEFEEEANNKKKIKGQSKKNATNKKHEPSEYEIRLMNRLKNLEVASSGKINKSMIKEIIIKHNSVVCKQVEDFRIILVNNNKVNTGFHLSLKSFSSIYGDMDILEILKDADKFEEAFKNVPRYEDSILKSCLSQEYNLYVVIIENEEIKNVRYREKYSFQFEPRNEAVFKNIYDLTIEAFRKGEWAMIPKSNMKNIIYVAPKARNGSDTFYFTDGEEHVKQTFWIHKNLIEKQIKKLIG